MSDGPSLQGGRGGQGLAVVLSRHPLLSVTLLRLTDGAHLEQGGRGPGAGAALVHLAVFLGQGAGHAAEVQAHVVAGPICEVVLLTELRSVLAAGGAEERACQVRSRLETSRAAADKERGLAHLVMQQARLHPARKLVAEATTANRQQAPQQPSSWFVTFSTFIPNCKRRESQDPVQRSRPCRAAHLDTWAAKGHETGVKATEAVK